MAMEKNHACLLYGTRDARFEDIPVPSLDGKPRDVLIRIAFTGVCGSDVCRLQIFSVAYTAHISL